MFDGAVDTILQRRGEIAAIGYQKAQAENAIERRLGRFGRRVIGMHSGG